MEFSELSSCINELLVNDRDVFEEAVNVLLRISSNILKDPKNVKYRTLALGSQVFINKILPASGSYNVLLSMGFDEDTDKLIFPEAAPLDRLRLLHDELMQCRNTYRSKTANQSKAIPSTSIASQNVASIPVMPPVKIKAAFSSELGELLGMYCHNNYLTKLIQTADSVLKMEDTKLKLKALKCIPMNELHYKVEVTLRAVQEAFKKKTVTNEHEDYQELMLNCLVTWFKNDFFSWVDSPIHCDIPAKFKGSIPPTHSTIDRVEVYVCVTCGAEVQFPRYNDASILLDTRKGRCGEWGKCFTLLCRALGWDARIVYDETDHVWTEVYLALQNRWVHCDPCEGIVDAPLLYEAGWKKKLSYIIAFSCEEVQDVTWRYSSHHKLIRQRRKACSEEDLVNLILKIREIRTKSMSTARKTFIFKRSLLESVMLMVEPTPKEEDLKGRSSGSLAWRLARGDTEVTTSNSNEYTWTISAADLQDGVACIAYSASQDAYTKGIPASAVVKGWREGAYSARNIKRKVEHDWKMVYLARTENNDSGAVTWRIEMIEGLELGVIELNFSTAVYETGSIDVTLSSGKTLVQFPSGNSKLVTSSFKGLKDFQISALLSGGKGDVAWQHTQLFRQATDDQALPFLVKIHASKPTN